VEPGRRVKSIVAGKLMTESIMKVIQIVTLGFPKGESRSMTEMALVSRANEGSK
jgi:hypothetical protein